MSVGALAAIFGTSFVVSLTGALSPGPLTTLAIREGVRRGFWAGPVLAFGHGAIELPLVVGLALGLDQVLDSDAVTAAVALVGGSFLIWLGTRTALTAPRQELRIESETASTNRNPGGQPPAVPGTAALAVQGLAVSVSNPFWLAWWATIGAAYIVEALDQGVAGVASFYSAHILTDLGWLSVIALALASGRRIMSRKAYQLVLGACGLLLIALGGWFLASGLDHVA